MGLESASMRRRSGRSNFIVPGMRTAGPKSQTDPWYGGSASCWKQSAPVSWRSCCPFALCVVPSSPRDGEGRSLALTPFMWCKHERAWMEMEQMSNNQNSDPVRFCKWEHQDSSGAKMLGLFLILKLVFRIKSFFFLITNPPGCRRQSRLFSDYFLYAFHSWRLVNCVNVLILHLFFLFGSESESTLWIMLLFTRHYCFLLGFFSQKISNIDANVKHYIKTLKL